MTGGRRVGVAVAALGALALVLPLLAPHPPEALGVGPALAAPSLAHPLGTDGLGRDVASRVLTAARPTVAVAVGAVAGATLLGVALGAAAAVGGAVRGLLDALGDLLLALPRLVLLLALVGVLRPGPVAAVGVVVGALALTGWPTPYRLVRDGIIAQLDRPYVEVGVTLGLSTATNVVRHALPHALGPVLVHACLATGATMLAEAGLSFLGAGLQPPATTWGALVAEGRDALRIAPWVALGPAAAIALCVVGLHRAADGPDTDPDP